MIDTVIRNKQYEASSAVLTYVTIWRPNSTLEIKSGASVVGFNERRMRTRTSSKGNIVNAIVVS